MRGIGSSDPAGADVARINALAGAPAVRFRRAVRGYSPAERWSVTLADGRRVFAKIGSDPLTAGWLRTERKVYAALAGDFMPSVRGWDDGARPLLLLEDLSDCRWPPPWDAAGVDRVLAALARLRAADTGGALPPLSATNPELAGSWRRVAAAPAEFLSLGLTSEDWLRGSAGALIAAAEGAQLDGPCPTHMDVRSDNICFRGGQALLVDWNHAVLAAPDVDVACWLPSLHAEGGPAPEEILPHGGPLAAVISGYFAEHAGKPLIPTAPRVRKVQAQQLRTALPWAARALGLPPPDGPNGRHENQPGVS